MADILSKVYFRFYRFHYFSFFFFFSISFILICYIYLIKITYGGLLLQGLRQVAPQLFGPNNTTNPMEFANCLPMIMQRVPQLQQYPQSM